MKKLFALILVVITVILSFGVVNVSANSGYVTISFQDYGIRGSDKGDFPHQLGKIINKTKVKINKNDTIATVTLRLLKEKGIKPAYTGKPEMGGGFYLASIDNFTTVSGKKVSDGYGLGEFSVGSESGWMISYNNWFINKGASEFYVKNNDEIKWQFTATGLGKDIGCDFNNPNAKIKNLHFTSGKLSPSFSTNNKSYTLTLPKGKSTVAISATLENYYSRVTYHYNGKSYSDNEYFKVKDNTAITVKSVFDNGEGKKDSDTVTVKVKIPTSKTTKNTTDKTTKKNTNGNSSKAVNKNSVKNNPDNNINSIDNNSSKENKITDNKKNNTKETVTDNSKNISKETVSNTENATDNNEDNNSDVSDNSDNLSSESSNNSVKEINTVNGFFIFLIIIAGVVVLAIIVCIMILLKNNKERKQWKNYYHYF